MNWIERFFQLCAAQEKSGPPPSYDLPIDVVRGLRVELVNMAYDEPQEEFFLGLLTTYQPVLNLEAHYVLHLKEFLHGATNATRN